jgi:hypothetical protein
MAQDGGGFFRRPVVQDHAKEIYICGFDVLVLEEIMRHKCDLLLDTAIFLREVGVRDGFGQVLDDEVEFGECLCKSNAAMAC